MVNISQRDAFWNRVYERAKSDKDIVVISADMGAPALDKFRKYLASQFINVGIAEQNAITLASGLSLGGKKVFTYAIAPFITLRCLEQIRVENAIANIPITIVGVGAGFSYEDSGPTHHLVEDIAVMRSLPHITINSITDNIMAGYFADRCCDGNTNTHYIRLERKVYPNLYNKHTDFSKGLAILRQAKDSYIISTSSMTHTALDVANRLAKNKIKVGVIDLFTFPINEKELLSVIKKAKRIITLEEHFLAGGLGSAVGEVLADHSLLIPLKRIGIPMAKGYCYKYGGREIIRSEYGIDLNTVTTKVRNFFSGR